MRGDSRRFGFGYCSLPQAKIGFVFPFKLIIFDLTFIRASPFGGAFLFCFFVLQYFKLIFVKILYKNP